MRLQSIAPDEVLAQRLGPLDPLEHASSPFELGWRCQLLSPSSEADRYRAQLLAMMAIEEGAARTLLAGFDAGRAYARGELAGIRSEFDLDRFSHLGSQKLHGEGGGSSWVSLDLAMTKEGLGDRALACWDFTGSTPVGRGLAREAKAQIGRASCRERV